MKGQPIVKIIGPSSVQDGNFKNDAGENVAWSKKSQPSVCIRGEFREPMNIRLRPEQPDYPPGEYFFDMEQCMAINNGNPVFQKFHVLVLAKP